MTMTEAPPVPITEDDRVLWERACPVGELEPSWGEALVLRMRQIALFLISPREIYAVSDVVYSLSTKPETFGRTTLEALCLGTPVLGWDKGGVGEILHRRFPAGTVADGDFGDLLAATRHVLDNTPHPVDDGSFRLDTMQAQTLALYRALARDAAGNTQ